MGQRGSAEHPDQQFLEFQLIFGLRSAVDRAADKGGCVVIGRMNTTVAIGPGNGDDNTNRSRLAALIRTEYMDILQEMD